MTPMTAMTAIVIYGDMTTVLQMARIVQNGIQKKPGTLDMSRGLKMEMLLPMMTMTTMIMTTIMTTMMTTTMNKVLWRCQTVRQKNRFELWRECRDYALPSLSKEQHNTIIIFSESHTTLSPTIYCTDGPPDRRPAHHTQEYLRNSDYCELWAMKRRLSLHTYCLLSCSWLSHSYLSQENIPFPLTIPRKW